MTRIKWLSLIRITGLFLVLGYHFFKDMLPGGFIGVDVFFTLSGFLVTFSMVSEFQKNGDFGLFAFYKRRFTRIYPPLLLSILFTLPFTLLISPDFTVNLGRQIAAALGFVTNYFEIINGGSYEAQMLPHLFLHTWFLAVEFHFYLLWGLVFAGLAWLVKKLGNISPDKTPVIFRVIIFTFSMIGAFLSYFRMQELFKNSNGDPSAAYFDTGARAFSFLLGAAAASLFMIRSKVKKEKRNSSYSGIKIFLLVSIMAALTCILFVLARRLTFTAEYTYRFGFVISSVITVIIILLTRSLHELTPNSGEPRLLTIPAELSYNIYLFHWPLHVVFFSLYWNNLTAAIITLLVSVVFSFFVTYGYEPLLHGKINASSFRSPLRYRIFCASFIIPVIAALLPGGIIIKSAPQISSLEAQLHAGLLYQDVDRISSLQRLTKNINEQPMSLPIPAYVDRQIPAASTGTIPAASFVYLPALHNNVIVEGVTIIGDSIAMGAYRRLSESIPNCFIDNEKSREIWQGYNIIMGLQQSDSLREYVVVALGTNQHANSLERIDRIINDIKPGHRLIFVTPYNGAMNELWMTYKIMQYMRTLPDIYPFVTVADWAALIKDQPQFLASDKVHIDITTAGAALYTQCIINAINEAAQKPAKPD